MQVGVSVLIMKNSTCFFNCPPLVFLLLLLLLPFFRLLLLFLLLLQNRKPEFWALLIVSFSRIFTCYWGFFCTDLNLSYPVGTIIKGITFIYCRIHLLRKNLLSICCVLNSICSMIRLQCIDRPLSSWNLSS